MDVSKLRAWWSHQQGLDGSLQAAAPAAVLEQAGWARSVGGAGPYLTLFARAGISRAEADQAVAGVEIHELPAARGCTYVVPASDFALALTAGREFGQTPIKQAEKLGVTEKEIEKLCDAVLIALSGGPLSPEQIRAATGDASRSLGEEGKRRGLTTTLPLALGRLQTLGEIRRIPVNGRLDQQRYLYSRWRPNPLDGCSLSPSEAYTELARRFFKWVGPATLGEFRWFSGLGVKAAQQAVEPLRLVPAEPGESRLMFEDDREAFGRFTPSRQPHYVLVSSLDAIHSHRRDVQGLLDQSDAEREVLVDRSNRSLGDMSDLPNHAILDRGRLVGLWEYDSDSRSIAWSAFGIKDKALAAAVALTESFVRDQLGDARSFSLDSQKSRAPRIAALRKQPT